MDRTALQHVIEQLLASGRLPAARPGRVFASYGNGAPCTVCSDRVGPNDVLYTVCFNAEKLGMHLDCFEGWDRMRPRSPGTA